MNKVRLKVLATRLTAELAYLLPSLKPGGPITKVQPTGPLFQFHHTPATTQLLRLLAAACGCTASRGLPCVFLHAPAQGPVRVTASTEAKTLEHSQIPIAG